MATEILAAPSGETRAVSTASGGTALTSTAVTLGFPMGTRRVDIIPRNFGGGATVVRYAFGPWLTILKTSNNFVDEPIDYSEAAQDANTSTVVDLSSLDTLANGDALWIGSHAPFRGVAVDVNAANGNASVLTATYWDGTGLTSLSATDGTTNGFSADGNVTWTVPAAGLWKAEPLVSVLRKVGMSPKELIGPKYETPLYWTRWVYSVAFDSSTTLSSMHALNRSTAYAEITPSLGVTEKVQHGFGGCGSVELLIDAGTANAIVNVSTMGGVF